MADRDAVSVDAANAEIAKSRRGLIAALLAILLVVAAIVGVLYFTGIGPFAAVEVETVDQEPAAQPAETTATPVASPATVPLPPVEAQEAMYWEQVSSREQIADLVGDRFATFEFSEIARSADKADIRVRATYRDGTAMSGWMLLRQYEGAWYFSMITRDGHPTKTVPNSPPDMDVAKAMVEQQAANQDIPGAILDGGYTTVALSRVTVGSGTAMIDATFSGGSLPEAKGQITCIKKAVNGTTHWFITAFSRS